MSEQWLLERKWSYTRQCKDMAEYVKNVCYTRAIFQNDQGHKKYWIYILLCEPLKNYKKIQNVKFTQIVFDESHLKIKLLSLYFHSIVKYVFLL